jgi:ABC-2 type transport system ATP-binding protein
MEVSEYLKFVGKARSLDNQKLKDQINFVLDACELASVLRRPIMELSKGYRQRVGLAQALIHDPDILILDEPTSGLDPIQILGIRKLVKDLISKGKTIIFSTHILQEVVAVTERIIVINQGTIVADGTIGQISQRADKKRKVIVIIASNAPDIEKELSNIGATVSQEDGSLRAEFTGFSGQEIFEQIKERNWPVCELREDKATFEDAFIQLIREGKK